MTDQNAPDAKDARFVSREAFDAVVKKAASLEHSEEMLAKTYDAYQVKWKEACLEVDRLKAALQSSLRREEAERRLTDAMLRSAYTQACYSTDMSDHFRRLRAALLAALYPDAKTEERR